MVYDNTSSIVDSIVVVGVGEGGGGTGSSPLPSPFLFQCSTLLTYMQ